MEDFDILNKFDNDKLIDVVKNYKRYGYDDELRDYAINLLGERGWNREDLQQFGYLTNHDYDEAEKQYKAYKRNSLIGICTLIFSGGILAVVYLINEEKMDQEKHFPSHFGEVYDAMPEKFEKRKNKFKPIIYWVLTAVCVLLVIFPEWLPFIPSWLIRVVGVVGAIYLGLTALVADLSIYNRESGGEVKRYKTKKFISSMTDKEDIVDAFNRHDFEYLCDLPSGNDQPVQLQVEKDETGHEFYCILVTYTPGYKIVGLADPIILTGDEYEKNKVFIQHMCDHDAD